MSILSRVEINVSTADVSTRDGSGTAADDGIDLALPAAFGTSIHIGLERVLRSYSPVDHLLNGPDALARFRAGAVPADPSPIATRGMTIRAGDPYAEVATRYAVGITTAAPRLDFATRGGEPGGLAGRATIGVDLRGVAAVRDPVTTAAVPQRIQGADGVTAAGRGIEAKGVTTTILFIGDPAAELPKLSFAGLVNILGVTITAPHEAPIGAVLLYQRADGAVAAELRVATGYAGATATAALPLSIARSEAAYLLTGVFVAPPPPPPPDGSAIPAGHPAPPPDQRATVDAGPTGSSGASRPYLHTIWYDILALRFEAAGVALPERSAALRDVVWAVAIDHGPFATADGADVLSAVQRHIDVAAADDAAIVGALADERARFTPGGGLVHYPDVLPFDIERVVGRLAAEAALAIARIDRG